MFLPQNKEDLTSFVVICYSYGYNLPKETVIRDRLIKFGKIESILLRPAYNSSVRNYALVEFSTVDEAIACREYFLKGEESFANRLTLGDKRLEMNILVGSKIMRPFEAVVVPSTTSTQQFPGLLSALSAGPTIPAVSMSQPAQSGGLAMIQTTLPLSNKAFLSDMDKTVNDEIRMIFDPEYIRSIKEKDAPPPLKLSISPIFMHSANREEIFEQQEEFKGEVSVVKIDNGEPVELQIEKNQELLWSGFIIKGNDTKNTVGVDAYFISGEKSAFTDEMSALWPADHILNMSHKCDYSELTLPTPLTVLAFLPSNKTQAAKFLDFRNYFREKRIVTKVRHFRNKILYIFPYCQEFSSYVPLDDGQYMVGVFVEAKGNQNAGSVNPPSIQMVDGAQLPSHHTSQSGGESENQNTDQSGEGVDDAVDFDQATQAKLVRQADSVDVEGDEEGFETPKEFQTKHLGKRSPNHAQQEQSQSEMNTKDNSPKKKLKTATVNLEDDLILPIMPAVEVIKDDVQNNSPILTRMGDVEVQNELEDLIVLNQDASSNQISLGSEIARVSMPKIQKISETKAASRSISPDTEFEHMPSTTDPLDTTEQTKLNEDRGTSQSTSPKMSKTSRRKEQN
jgi:SPOC domain